MLIITIIPSVLEICVILSESNGVELITKNIFFSDVDETIENLLSEYSDAIDAIYIDMSSQFSEKVYDKLITNTKINCKVIKIGEK